MEIAPVDLRPCACQGHGECRPGCDAVTCPFCGDADFDLIGLKMHFERGWCKAYNATPTGDQKAGE